MKNALIPSRWPFDEDGKVINIADMTPHSLDSHCAGRPARFAPGNEPGLVFGQGYRTGIAHRGLLRPPGRSDVRLATLFVPTRRCGAVRSWLIEPGSLTARCQDSCDRFGIRVVTSGRGRCAGR